MSDFENNDLEKLIELSRDKSNYKNRLAAVEGLGKLNVQQSKDIIVNLAIHDRVFAVKEAAFKMAQKNGYTKQGKPIRLGKKDTGYKSADVTKVFKRIRRELNVPELDIDAFKEHWKAINPEMFDVFQYDKGKKFDDFIANKYGSLPKDKA